MKRFLREVLPSAWPGLAHEFRCISSQHHQISGAFPVRQGLVVHHLLPDVHTCTGHLSGRSLKRNEYTAVSVFSTLGSDFPRLPLPLPLPPFLGSAGLLSTLVGVRWGLFFGCAFGFGRGVVGTVALACVSPLGSSTLNGRRTELEHTVQTQRTTPITDEDDVLNMETWSTMEQAIWSEMGKLREHAQEVRSSMKIKSLKRSGCRDYEIRSAGRAIS